MQLLFEIILLKKPKIVDSNIEVMAFMSIGGAISFTILNFASYAGIKWLAILAVIDLVYFVCWKLCGLTFYMIWCCAHFGIDFVKEVMFGEFDVIEAVNEIFNK